jgi:hypothetical protein
VSATFTFINPGRPFVVKPEMRKSLGFTKGRVLRLITTWERTAVDGGYYTVQRLDGAEDLRDLTPDLHRSSFVPVSNTILARLGRRKSKR